MKLIKKLLFMFVLVAGLSVGAMAQKGDPPRRPPKDPPPVINPRGEKPPKENPKGGDKPKKPGLAAIGKPREEDVV